MTHSLSSLSSRGSAAVSRLAADWHQKRALRSKYRRTLAELQGTSSRDLADLGIARADIPDLVYRSVYGA